MLDNKFVISLISRGMIYFQGSRVMRLPEHSMLNTNNLVIRIQLEFSLFRKSSMFGRIRTTNAYTHTGVFGNGAISTNFLHFIVLLFIPRCVQHTPTSSRDPLSPPPLPLCTSLWRNSPWHTLFNMSPTNLSSRAIVLVHSSNCSISLTKRNRLSTILRSIQINVPNTFSAITFELHIVLTQFNP